ncbi:MAG: LptF/LptG family permease [Prolixibacteraceae bacterium]|nr:LptF/LptG family permease [Prolixibacteraceae bacterium]MBN2773942.1 LptF/LptG family permease [Prolixibacteraceae bacterium]
MKLIKTIDIYITKKFLGTFFYAIILIIMIVVVFDAAENLDEYLAHEVPVNKVIFDYYLNFIPYFTNLFSGLFTFIAVIYFTSKMAYNTEIIAILSSGVSYRRLMMPYIFSALVIAALSFVLGNYIIPPANKTRINFRNTYIKNYVTNESQIHRQIEPGVYIYMRRFTGNNVGEKFILEKFEGSELVEKINAENIRWDEEKKEWILNQYTKRTIIDGVEEVTRGYRIDTTLNMQPEEYRTIRNETETMTTSDINRHIVSMRTRGVNPIEFEIEKHKRGSGPFSVFILTLIGAGLASRKVKGGLGFHLGLGILFSFSYIFFSQISTIFAVNGNMHPFIAVWIPNFFYGVIAFIIYKWAAR